MENTMENPESPQSDSTPTEVFVEHNPLPEEEDTFSESDKTASQNSPQSNSDSASSLAVSNQKHAKGDSHKGTREIRRTSTSRVTETRILPRVDCHEKIVICIDMSTEMKRLPFKFGDGTRLTASDMIRRVVEIFLHSKNRINHCHEFALILLYESAVWCSNFSSDINDVITQLHSIGDTTETKSLNLTSIFEAIDENVTLPEHESNSKPPYIVRTIILYTRSHCIPTLDRSSKVYWKFRNSPYFFLDAFYIHEPLHDDNQCQEIYDIICDLDESGLSYVFEVTRNTTKLHNYMARLLSHPLQRPQQTEANYRIVNNNANNSQ